MRTEYNRIVGDQAIVLRRMARDARAGRAEQHRTPNGKGRIVVVAGAKGGVGATTLALRLAVGVSQEEPTIVVDANLRQPDLAILAGAASDDRQDLNDVLAGACHSQDALTPVGENLQLLPGGWASATQPDARPESLARWLDELQQLADAGHAVIIDAGAGIRPWSEPCWRAASQVMLVTTPDRVASLDAYAVTKLARSEGIQTPIGLMVNLAQDDHHAREVHGRVEATCRRFLQQGLPLVGHTPYDQGIASAGVPTHPDQDLGAWAQQLAWDAAPAA